MWEWYQQDNSESRTSLKWKRKKWLRKNQSHLTTEAWKNTFLKMQSFVSLHISTLSFWRCSALTQEVFQKSGSSNNVSKCTKKKTIRSRFEGKKQCNHCNEKRLLQLYTSDFHHANSSLITCLNSGTFLKCLNIRQEK